MNTFRLFGTWLNTIVGSFTLVVIIISGCSSSQKETAIIPLPKSQIIKSGKFSISKETQIYYSDSLLAFEANYAAELWEKYLDFALPTTFEKGIKDKTHSILLQLASNDSLGDEGYYLNINEHNIKISANKRAGIFYGIQTVFQLFETSINGSLPCLEIIDSPRFPYRGMHLDVARHFMPESFIYKILDYMAMHKLNQFHWHLVDDQGWRIEIKQYPELTNIGAWRVDMNERHWNNRPLTNDRSNANYGGFYTQEQIRRIVAYAKQRNITVMPEIEMPAHVMSALAAYPELSCTGENLGVPPGGVWPITHIYCAGNEQTFTFIENVLTEVMDLFPSELIHIGGDEADKTNWQKCTKCQQRMQDEGLANEAELQSYFVRRIGEFLNKNNRTLVGWDEILEGGSINNTVIMSWRGEEGGIEAAKNGNKAIMTPGSHCYFDHYQGDADLEPLAFGGYTPLKKVYDYEPIPIQLNDEQAKLIIGAQANHWSEYMPNEKQVEYMAFPRLAALAEVLWSPKNARSWPDFSRRMYAQYNRYEALGINYSKSAFQVKINAETDTLTKSIKLKLETDVPNAEIRYTINGNEPNINSSKYTTPVSIDKTSTIKAAVFVDDKLTGEIRTARYNIHKAFCAKVKLKHLSHKKYNGKGNYTLVDGINGTTNHADGHWKGFLKNDMVASVDLGMPTSFRRIAIQTLQNITSWIFFPTQAIFEVSDDNINFEAISIKESPHPLSQGGKIIYNFICNNNVENKQYLRITLKNPEFCPKGHAGEGNPAFIFAGEIIVE